MKHQNCLLQVNHIKVLCLKIIDSDHCDVSLSLYQCGSWPHLCVNAQVTSIFVLTVAWMCIDEICGDLDTDCFLVCRWRRKVCSNSTQMWTLQHTMTVSWGEEKWLNLFSFYGMHACLGLLWQCVRNKFVLLLDWKQNFRFVVDYLD